MTTQQQPQPAEWPPQAAQPASHHGASSQHHYPQVNYSLTFPVFTSLHDTHRVSRSDEHAPIGDSILLTLQVPPLQLQAPRQPQLHGHRMQQQQGGRGGAPLQQQHLPPGHQQHTAFSRAAAAQDAAQLTPKATGLGHTFPRSVCTISTDHVRVAGSKRHCRVPPCLGFMGLIRVS